MASEITKLAPYVRLVSVRDMNYIPNHETHRAGIGGKFNLVLSDAMHNEEALEKELEQLMRNELVDLNEPFVMFWDDCAGNLAQARRVLTPIVAKANVALRKKCMTH